MRKAEENQCLGGFPIDNNISISLLQFADDTVIFCDGTESNLCSIKAILRSFEMASGLKINFAKSNIIGINFEERVLTGASVFMACSVGKMPFKFLGIPVGENPRRYHTWEPVLNAMRLKLSSWRRKQLRIGGRVTLINLVLSSLPFYFFSFFKVPKKVLGEMVRIQRQFLWGGNNEHKKMAWITWETICLPKTKEDWG